jgi:hypothetical protein
MNEFYVAPLGGISMAPQLTAMGDTLRADRKAEADKQAKMQRFAEVKSAMEEAYGSGNPDQMAMVAMNYPEAQKTIEMLVGFQSDKTKKQGLDTYRQVLGLKGNPQAAANALQGRVDYLTENGANPQHTQADLDELRGAIERGEDPTPIFNNMEMAYAGLASPQEWKAYKGDTDKSKLGKYNPRDYTTESWSIFTRSGNPDDLERYESQSVIESGGAQYLVDRVTGARTQISSTKEAATGQASIASSIETAKKEAIAIADDKSIARSNEKALKAYDAAIGGLSGALDKAYSGPVAGLMPAITDNAKVAEGAIAVMAPVLKGIFRASGEGTFTDSDQKMLMSMLPTRADSKESGAMKLKMVDEVVRAKLGGGSQPKGTEAVKPAGGVLVEDAGGNRAWKMPDGSYKPVDGGQ